MRAGRGLLILSVATLSWTASATSRDPLTLRGAIDLAIASNPNIRAAREKSVELDENVGLAISQFLPTISATGSAVYRKDPIVSPLALFGGTPYNLYTLGVQITQPIFTGGTQTGGLRFAHEARAMSDLDLAIAERDLTVNVINAFYGVILGQNNVETLKRNIDVQRRLLVETRKRQAIGRSQVLDVLQIQTQLALLNPKLAQAENAVRISASQLANVLGDRGATEISVLGQLDPPPLASIQTHLKGASNRILENEKIDHQLQQLDGTRSILLAKHWPQVGALANWGRSAYVKSDLLNDDATTWALGVQVSIPLFSGLSSFREREVIASQERQVDISRSKLLDTTALAQVQTRKNLELAWDTIDSSKVAFELSIRSLKEAEKDYRLATIQYLQYLTSEQALLSAELAYDQSKFDYINSLSQYFVSWGYPVRQLVEWLDKKG